MYNLCVIPHYRRSYISASGRGYERHDNISEIHVYRNTYSIKDFADPFCQLEFALKYDGINLEILRAVFNKRVFLETPGNNTAAAPMVTMFGFQKVACMDKMYKGEEPKFEV